MSRKLPTVVSPIAPDLRRFLDRMKETLESPEGLVTKRDLVQTGVFQQTPRGDISFADPDRPSSCVSPPAPLELTANGAMTSVILEWGGTFYNSCYSYTEVWRCNTDDLGAATLIGTTSSGLFTDAVGTEASNYYWVRFVNILGQEGAFNFTDGVLGKTSPDVGYLIDQLSDAYGSTSQAPFFQIDEATIINGVSIPAGTYMKAAYIHDAAITEAKIGDLAVDTAKIADLAVSEGKIANLAVNNAKIKDLNAEKITAGFIAAARINANTINADHLVVGSTPNAITPGTIGAVSPGDVYSSRLDVAFFVHLDGSTTGAEANSFPTGTYSGGDYVAASKGDLGYIGVRTVNWSADNGEVAPSVIPAEYDITKLAGDPGTNFHVQLVSDNGHSFKNNTGSVKTLTANVYINGVLAPTTAHSTYVYQWYNGNDRAYVTSSGDYVGTSPSSELYPADGADETNGLNFRSIKVDSSDVGYSDSLNLHCVVTDNT